MTAHGLPSVPDRKDSAVQFFAYDPAGGDTERAWRIKNLNDFLTAGAGPVISTFRIAWNTPGLQGGLLAFTLSSGDLLPTPGVVCVITESWNGTTPQINTGYDQAHAADGNISTNVLNPVADSTPDPGLFQPSNIGIQFSSPVYPKPDPVELWVGVDDGFGGPTGATQGAAVFFLTRCPFA